MSPNVTTQKSPSTVERAQERPRKRTSETQSANHWGHRVLHVLVLALLLTIVAAPSLLPKYSVVDNDLWMHIRVGDWIRQNSTFPHTGIFSRTAADRPWAAYSWVYEVLLSIFHSRFHLIGIAVYGWLLMLAVAYGVFWMTRRLSGWFWRACLLATLTCAASLFRVYPRPVFFSMALFTVTLTLLLEARRTGRVRLLYWLPPIFVLWANSHVQFIYGLFLLGLFVAVNVAQEFAARRGFAPDFLLSPSLPSRTVLLILAACVLATCAGPYTYHLYSIVFGYATAQFPYQHLWESRALTFRTYTDFVQLLLAGFALFSLLRQKKRDLFLLLLLGVASMMGFRTQRDAWFVCIPAAACIAEVYGQAQQRIRETIWEKASLALSLLLLISLYARLVDFNTQNLRLAVAAVYPVRAINFLREHPQPGPIYNTFGWGDFIAWYMPEYPVAIDGRTDLYGDEIDNRFFMTENGDPSWSDDPYLNESKLVLLPRDKPLASLLRSDSRFTLIYEDSLSMVFVKR